MLAANSRSALTTCWRKSPGATRDPRAMPIAAVATHATTNKNTPADRHRIGITFSL
jgi:hypothetical protein